MAKISWRVRCGAPPAVGVGLEAQHVVLHVAAEAVGAGAHRAVVEGLRPTFAQQLGRVLGRLDAREGQRHVAGEADVGLAQAKAHRVLAQALDGLDLPRQSQAFRVDVGRRQRLVEGVLGVDEAAEGEQQVVGVEGTRRREICRAVEAHAPAQLEIEHLGVGRHRPRAGQLGLQLGAAGLETQQALEDRARGVGRAAAVPAPGIEALGAGVGAVDERLGGPGGAGDKEGEQGERDERDEREPARGEAEGARHGPRLSAAAHSASHNHLAGGNAGVHPRSSPAARTPSRRMRALKSTRFRHRRAACSSASALCTGASRVWSRVSVRKPSKRSLMPTVRAP
jgi:hypothetical protein